MDRTKGQIAWLELQKQKYQERGLTAQITAVKKKQRALLMRLEKERAELARFVIGNTRLLHYITPYMYIIYIYISTALNIELKI